MMEYATRHEVVTRIHTSLQRWHLRDEQFGELPIALGGHAGDDTGQKIAAFEAGQLKAPHAFMVLGEAGISQRRAEAAVRKTPAGVESAIGTKLRCSAALILRDPGSAVPDAIARTHEGFHLGRLDPRVPSNTDFLAGANLRVLELNGLTGNRRTSMIGGCRWPENIAPYFGIGGRRSPMARITCAWGIDH